MKKLIFLTLALCLLSSVSFAQEEATVTLKGYIIDNLCSSGKDSATLDEFVKMHTKSCALAPQCVASGYAIYADHTLYSFDSDSNSKIEEFLKKEDSTLLVIVEAKKSGDKLSLVSIKNEK